MQYVLLDIGYQEIAHGQVVRYTDLDGNTIVPSSGYGGKVVDPNPPTPAWALPDPVETVTPEPSARQISKTEYMSRFSDAELAAIYTVAKTTIQVEIWLEKFKVAEFIDLSDPRTIDGVHALEAVGLIAEGRAHEILA
jgi:hypothetical protein